MRAFPVFLFTWTLTFICYAESKWVPNFFVPEEVQTILQLVYSRLPPTKIGSDKRFGVGFRLGKNADAQILIELGPQSDTQPLADPGNGFSKRQSRQKPSAEYTRSNSNLVDLKLNHTKQFNHKRNHTKTTNEKSDSLTLNKKENINASNVQRSEPLESFVDIFMRWFRWLTQPTQGSIKSKTYENREKSVNKAIKEEKYQTKLQAKVSPS